MGLPILAMDYQGGEEFDGISQEDGKKITQKLSRPELERKIRELERTGNEDASGKIVYSSDVAKQLKDLYKILEDTGGRGFVPIDINAASDYWLNNKVDNFLNDLSSGEQISYQNKILNRGQYQLSEEEQNIRNGKL